MPYEQIRTNGKLLFFVWYLIQQAKGDGKASAVDDEQSVYELEIKIADEWDNNLDKSEEFFSAEWVEKFLQGESEQRRRIIQTEESCVIEYSLEEAKDFYKSYLDTWIKNELPLLDRTPKSPRKQIKDVVEKIYFLINKMEKNRILLNEDQFNGNIIEFCACVFFLADFEYITVKVQTEYRLLLKEKTLGFCVEIMENFKPFFRKSEGDEVNFDFRYLQCLQLSESELPEEDLTDTPDFQAGGFSIYNNQDGNFSHVKYFDDILRSPKDRKGNQIIRKNDWRLLVCLLEKEGGTSTFQSLAEAFANDDGLALGATNRKIHKAISRLKRIEVLRNLIENEWGVGYSLKI